MADNNENRKQGSLNRRGEGLGSGPVGNGPRGGGQGGSQQSPKTPYQDKQKQPNQDNSGNRGQAPRQSSGMGLLGLLFGGGLKRLVFIIILVIALVVIFKSCFGGGSSSVDSGTDLTTAQTTAADLTTAAPASSVQTYDDLDSILSGLGISNMVGTAGGGSYNTDVSQLSSGSYNTWTDANGAVSTTGNTNTLNTSTVAEARSKYTAIKGGGQDTVTIMLYMCGTDLESKYKMGTSDLQEMLNSNCGGNVNLIVLTGGCKKWQNNVVSNSVNQIYQVKNGQLQQLSNNFGNGAMTDPKTLSDFIQVCAQNFPANRYELIMWDHGGGSVSGYGYDEKQTNHDTMDLSEISQALKDGGVKFDFIGFDACLMATAETALMLNDYGDYMIASEESEPGIGWYYTEWLAQLTKDPSTDTVTIGKKIADDFVSQCAKSCKGQATTLSVIDLAEFAAAVPGPLADFATSTSNMVSSDYQTVSTARSRTHEFAASSKIDQIDLIHFAKNLGTAEGKSLANALQSAIKYNTTSSDVTNAYGVSIYFPYRRTSYVDKAVATYSAIGLGSEYSKCIQNFAATNASGQMASGGTANYGSSIFDMLHNGGQQQSTTGTLLDLLGGTSSSSSYSSSSSSTDLISGLLGSVLGSGSSSSSSSAIGSILGGMSGSNSGFLFGRAQDPGWIEDTSAYIADHLIEREKFNWTANPDGEKVLALDADDWKLLTDLQTSVYYDDGEGYIDLGTDQIYSFDKYGNLAMPEAKTWIAIVGVDDEGWEVEQPVAYYLENVSRNGSDYTITGYVPALLTTTDDDGETSEQRVNLTLVFTDEQPKGYIAGAKIVYQDGNEVEGKQIELTEKDENGNDVPKVLTVDFLCDYYDYNGNYLDSYRIGESALEISMDSEITTFDLETEYTSLMYKFTDIYSQTYWSEATK